MVHFSTTYLWLLSQGVNKTCSFFHPSTSWYCLCLTVRNSVFCFLLHIDMWEVTIKYDTGLVCVTSVDTIHLNKVVLMLGQRRRHCFSVSCLLGLHLDAERNRDVTLLCAHLANNIIPPLTWSPSYVYYTCSMMELQRHSVPWHAHSKPLTWEVHSRITFAITSPLRGLFFIFCLNRGGAWWALCSRRIYCTIVIISNMVEKYCV